MGFTLAFYPRVQRLTSFDNFASTDDATKVIVPSGSCHLL